MKTLLVILIYFIYIWKIFISKIVYITQISTVVLEIKIHLKYLNSKNLHAGKACESCPSFVRKWRSMDEYFNVFTRLI